MKKSEQFKNAMKWSNIISMVLVGFGVYAAKLSGYSEAKMKIARKAEEKHDDDVGRYVDVDGAKIDLDDLDN
jgi:hypothetical protein